MKLRVFAVMDTKANAFMRPFFAPTTGIAVRDFSDAAINPDTPVSKHPGDYRLAALGTWDDITGKFSDDADAPEWLGFASEFVNKG